ncbi:hypothetical protein F0562_013030 [Nyssa sinensis]|uniref:LOB domain-containing protein n=1 Tax=Nyssa sinensis TaxID=561372 RepID=A0A5J4ZX20_9ASTE|nr:hypothetical protein F0562_013030 [Nyssa sinensis]
MDVEFFERDAVRPVFFGHAYSGLIVPKLKVTPTVFVAKFFGRAGLMSFISAVPENQRPALFQSLLFEACGRTVNPVNGAVGLLWTGNWQVCQAAVETVLRGGTLRPIPELVGGSSMPPALDEASEAEVTWADMFKLQDPTPNSRSKVPKRRHSDEASKVQFSDLDLSLTPDFPVKGSSLVVGANYCITEKRRPGTPSMNSEESVTTTCSERAFGDQGMETKLLNLFS